LIARDDFLPRGFAIVGRRLVYSFGIFFLAAAAAVLLIVFRGITDRLIPLFAVRAFLAFTLSQAGMVMHWRKQSSRGPMLVNGLGAIATALALLVILTAKFAEGAWITVLAIPAPLILFKFVNRHYQRIKVETAAEAPLDLSNNHPPIVLLPTRGWDQLAEKALRFSMWLSTEVIAVHLSNLSGEEAEEQKRSLREQWQDFVEVPAKKHGVPTPRLRIAQSPYRRFLEPLLAQIDRVKQEHPDRTIAVVFAGSG
jgi:hypothetical protein